MELQAPAGLDIGSPVDLGEIAARSGVGVEGLEQL